MAEAGQKIKKASFWKRMIAFLLDTLIVWSPVGGVFMYLNFFGPSIPDHELFKLLGSALFFVYSVACESMFKTTIGKWVMSLKVISLGRRSFTITHALKRNVWRIVSSIPFGYGYLRVVAPHRLQTMHDEFAQCLVVQVARRRPKPDRMVSSQ